MNTVIEFSASLPRAVDIKVAGHDEMVAYISAPRETRMKAKPLNREVVKTTVLSV